MSGITELPQLPNVEQRFIDGKGKSLFATVPFKEGDVIFEEDPLVCCQYILNKYNGYSACDHCLRPLETVEENVARLTRNECLELPFLELDTTNKEDHRTCDNCGEKYCCEACKTVAWQRYHQLLCHQKNEAGPLTLLVEHWKQMQYPPELFTTLMLLARLVAIVQLAENKEAMYNQLMQFCHSTETSDVESLVDNILGEESGCDINSLWQLFSSTMLPRCQVLGDNIFVNSLLSMEGFITMLSLVHRNSQGIGTSSLAEWANKVVALNVPESERTNIDNLIDRIYSQIEEHIDSTWNNEGTGLYVMQSCINHSCVPNAKIDFPRNNSKLAVVVVRDISPGEEIVISYLENCLLNSSCHSRRKNLRSHYLFTCICPKCITDSSNEPDVTSEEEEDDEDDEDDAEM